ncbi:MAG: ATP-binding protein [Flavobacteriia bacterium]|nr:ATP-binding protein [Flavobacteriia bacterium]
MFYRKALKFLNKWKDSDSRKPLVIRGARQVGKTTLVHEFAKGYEQYLYINLEKNEYKKLFQDYSDIEEIAKQIFLFQNQLWTKRKNTLLFIDEIQEVPTAINILRYFKEDLPELHVIAAGSMLETLLGKNISFPVGRVSYMILRPVSFEEFLNAIGEGLVLEQYQKIPLNNYAHSKLLKLFHTYAIIGGMPEIVNHFSINNDLTALKPIYEELLNSYHEDAEKYAKNNEQLQLIRFLLNQILYEAGNRITFHGFGKSNYRSKEVGEVLRTLQKTHLLNLLYPCVGYNIPIEQDFRKAPRLHFLDTGLINFKVGLQKEIIGTADLCSVYQGKMIEHLVGQEILSSYFMPLDGLQFWVREKNSSFAELDYLYPCDGKLIPIEVKSGSKGKMKSLSLFMEKSKINYAIRFYAGEFKLDSVQTPLGKTFYLLNLPYFLAAKVEDYIVWLQNNLPYESGFVLKEPDAQYLVTKTNEKKNISIDQLKREHFEILRFCKFKSKSSKEILEDCLGISQQTRNKRLFINTLQQLDLLEWTIKEIPNSKKQRYQITKKGLEVLNSSS